MIRKDDFPLWEVHIKKRKKFKKERRAIPNKLSYLILLNTKILTNLHESSQDSSVVSALDWYLEGPGFKSCHLQLNFQLEKGCGSDSMQYPIKYGCVEWNSSRAVSSVGVMYHFQRSQHREQSRRRADTKKKVDTFDFSRSTWWMTRAHLCFLKQWLRAKVFNIYFWKKFNH